MIIIAIYISLAATVLVKSLDWSQPHPPRDNSNYKWSDQDLTTLSHTDVVIAADGEWLPNSHIPP